MENVVSAILLAEKHNTFLIAAENLKQITDQRLADHALLDFDGLPSVFLMRILRLATQVYP